jgi:hypothetical protein
MKTKNRQFLLFLFLVLYPMLAVVSSAIAISIQKSTGFEGSGNDRQESTAGDVRDPVVDPYWGTHDPDPVQPVPERNVESEMPNDPE